MMKKMLAVLLILAMSFPVMATDTLPIAPITVLKLNVGSIGNYVITVTTTYNAKGGNITWDSEPGIYASIGGLPLASSGTYPITTDSTCNVGGCTLALDLHEQLQSGVTVGQQYDTTITYKNSVGKAKAMATGSAIPLPELSTGILMSAGLIGLVSMRSRRKE